MSLAADAIRVGVSRFRRPRWSSGPQTQAAPSGAPSILGRSFREGRVLESGSNGMDAMVDGLKKGMVKKRRDRG